MIDFFIFGMPNILLLFLQRFGLISSSWFCRSILKRERGNFDRLFYIFCVLKIKMKKLMNSFKVRYSSWYFWYKCTFTNTTRWGCPCFISSFLLPLRLSLHHPLNSFRQIVICISIDNLLQYFLPSLLFLFFDSIN
jgi:hypothetical protein